jgi:pseudouridine-5'-phosphate glycosidase
MVAMIRHSIQTLSIQRLWARGISSLVNVSAEVKSAVSSGAPVLALESTIITHGSAPHQANANESNRDAIPAES